MKLFKYFLNHFFFFLDIKLGWKYQWKVVILSLMVLICCICYKFHKANMKSGGSYINSSNNWIKNKKSINKSHQKRWWIHWNYCVKSWRNRKKISKEYKKSNFHKLLKLEMNELPIRKEWWKNFEKNNQTIVLNVLYVNIMNMYLPTFEKKT